VPRQIEVQRKVEVEGGGGKSAKPVAWSKTRPKRAKFGVIMFPQASNCALGGLWGAQEADVEHRVLP
jgi:hypothetical protein